MEFQKWPKIPRLNRDIIITEKIDGTNGQVYIMPLKNSTRMRDDFEEKGWRTFEIGVLRTVWAVVPGSRNKYVTLTKDNYGFAKWVNENAFDLLTLGPGRHYGEWWGKGIQRKYDMDERRFSLFNVSQYAPFGTDFHDLKGRTSVPECCHVVPLLYEGIFSEEEIEGEIIHLHNWGSVAAPGFMKPEGIVVFHTAANQTFKVTLENDEQHKGELNE